MSAMAAANLNVMHVQRTVLVRKTNPITVIGIS